MGGREPVLRVAEAGPADHARRHHADAAHDADRDRAGLREPVARHREHRRPEERLADAVDQEREHRAGKRLDPAGQEQTDEGEERTRQQDADRRQADALLDEVGGETAART